LAWFMGGCISPVLRSRVAVRSRSRASRVNVRFMVVGAVAAGTIALIGSAPASAGVTPARAVELLNAQRASNGLPANITERQDWSAACAKHNYYMRKAGYFGHDEDPQSPYYTADGAWAGQNSVLTSGGVWEYQNPWETAPIHLIQLLAPKLAEMGVNDSTGTTGIYKGVGDICATTWPGYTRAQPSNVAAYSYPGDGQTGVDPLERASESPFVPGDFVGLPGGSRTGPYLIVFLDGPGVAGASINDAALHGPSGDVAVKTVDSTHGTVGPYMPDPSGFVIPVKPLTPNTTYQATVNFQTTSGLVADAFSFTTGEHPPVSPKLSITSVQRRGHRLRIKGRIRGDAKGVLKAEWPERGKVIRSDDKWVAKSGSLARGWRHVFVEFHPRTYYWAYGMTSVCVLVRGHSTSWVQARTAPWRQKCG
jgi:hypothetical protein